MSNVTTWAVLSDGRYIKILVDKGEGKTLVVLDADDLKAYADLCYYLVNAKPLDPAGNAVKPDRPTNIQLQADFMAEHHKLGMFDRLILVAPQEVLSGLKAALPEQLTGLIDGELAEDLTVTSNDVIQDRIGNMIATS